MIKFSINCKKISFYSINILLVNIKLINKTFKKMRKFYTNTITGALFKRSVRPFCVNDAWLTNSINKNYDNLMKDFKFQHLKIRKRGRMAAP